MASKREMDDLRPLIDKVIYKFLGFQEPSLVVASMTCIEKGYDKKKTIRQLETILDDKAEKYADKLFDVLDGYHTNSRHSKNRKRRERDEEREERTEKKKSRRFDEAPPTNIPEPGQPSPGMLTADKIKEMMDSAQRMIKERKTQLNIPAVPPSLPRPSSHPDMLRTDAVEKAKRSAELQARIQASMSNLGAKPGLGLGALQPPKDEQKPGTISQPTPLILDEYGRTIDAKTGEAITLSHHMPTLKANIRAKRREQFKIVQEKPPEEISESKFFDARVSMKEAMRHRRGFRFHDKGKFQEIASRLRTKAQLDRLQNDIAQVAKKTGIASAAKLAIIQPKTIVNENDIPEVEWWDGLILKEESYELLGPQPDEKTHSLYEGITSYVEHPIQMKPPAEPTKSVEIAVMLTKKERKKLRRQNRQEAQKEITEKVRLGLMPPPEPKVRMANLMRVLGTEAIQDPTKVEAHVRAQMVKRQKAHQEANEARKLTKDQKREKKMKKFKEDTTLGVHVSVYRIRELRNASKKFKVETNAQQLFMTGIVVIFKDCNVVVVEGGPKQQKKFRRLMLHRIKWEEEKCSKGKDEDDDDDSDDDETPYNSCVLVWEGTTQSRSFSEIKFKNCPTEAFAREQFRKAGVEQYWNLAYSGAVLEQTGDDD